MPKKSITTDFTTGSIPRHLIKFSVPFVATNLLQVMYSLVDMIIVGQYVGKAGLSAVSQGGVIMSFITFLGIGLTNAGQTIVAQLIGAGKKEDIKRVVGTMFSFLFFVAVLIITIVCFFRRPLINLIKVPAEAVEMAVQYVAICSVGIIFLYWYNAMAATLRGAGDSKSPFKFITISAITNLCLDFFMTGLLKMGVKGAALATAASQVVAFILALHFLYKNRDVFGLEFNTKYLVPDKNYFPLLIKLGIPLAMQSCVVSFSMMAVNMFVNQVGVAASATFGVGVKIDDLLNKATNGIQYATAPIIGQNVGAKCFDRVKSSVRWCWAICGIISVLFIVVYLTNGKFVFKLFTSDDDVIELAPVFISAIIWSFPAMALMRGSMALMHGTGNTFILMWYSFLDAGLRVILAYILGITINLGFFGFSLGYGLAPFGVAIPGVIYYLTGKWKNKKIV